MSIKNVPGYGLVSGGERAGQYVRGGQYFRLVDGQMFNVDTGNPVQLPVGLSPRPAKAERAVAQPLTAEDVVAAEAAVVPVEPVEPESAPAGETVPAAVDAPSCPSAGETEARINALVADHTRVQLIDMLKAAKAAGAEVKIAYGKNPDATRANAAELLRIAE